MLDQAVDAKLRVDFAQHMYVVGHDFHSDDFSLIFCCHLSNHLFASLCDRANQHAPVLGVQTTWYLLLYTTFLFDLYSSSAIF